MSVVASNNRNRMKTAKMFFEPDIRNPVEFARLFQKGWSYPERLMKTNDKVSYRLLRATNPSSFYIELIDETSRSIEKDIIKAVREYTHFILDKKLKLTFPIDFMCEQMPVAVMNALNDVHRAEVKEIDADKKKVKVTLVDTGEELWVSMSHVFLPSTGLLRYPKLAIRCKLAGIVPPSGAKSWPEFNYGSFFQGSKTSLVCPFKIDRGVLAVCLECDGKDIAMQLVFNRLAMMVPLQLYYLQSDIGKRRYPLSDYSRWVGMKICIYGISIRAPNQVVLSLNPKNGNDLYDAIEEYVNKTPELDKIPFDKEVGCACLARLDGGRAKYYRVTILEIVSEGFFLVKYVEYLDFAVVRESDLAYIPDDVLHYPVAATLCAIAGLTNSKMNTEAMAKKLRELIHEQDFFGRIEATEYNSENPRNTARVLVSLSLPLGNSHYEVSFARLLDIPEVPLIQKYVKISPILSSEIGRLLLESNSTFSRNVKYSGVACCAQDEKSVWIQIEENSTKADSQLAKEMTEFYSSCKELGLHVSNAVPGTYVAALPKDFPWWYRAKIINFSKKHNSYQVFYLDYGCYGFVDLKNLKPLTIYFGYMPQLAMKTALPVKFRESFDLKRLLEFVASFCKYVDSEIDVWFRHANSINYAWIVNKDGTSLATELIKNGFATDVLFSDMWNLRG